MALILLLRQPFLDQMTLRTVALLLPSLLLCDYMSAPLARAESIGTSQSRDAVEEERLTFLASSASVILRHARKPTRGSHKLVDSAIASAIEYLTSTEEPDYLNCRNVDVHIVKGGVSQFHPEAGILIDEAQVRSFAEEVPTTPLIRSVLFVIAHECAHARQFKRYSLAFMKRLSNRRFLECQADLLAGIAIARPLKTPFVFQGGAVFPIRGLVEGMGKLSRQEMDDYELIAVGSRDWSRLARHIGSSEWHDTTTHPPPPYRMQTVLDGLYAGLYLKHVDKALETGAPELREFVEIWRANYTLQPPLPVMGEDIFEWSKRSAEKILAEEPNIAEPPTE